MNTFSNENAIYCSPDLDTSEYRLFGPMKKMMDEQIQIRYGRAISCSPVAWTEASVVFLQKGFRNLFIDEISVETNLDDMLKNETLMFDT